jgi:putative intracellular protease/amidase
MRWMKVVVAAVAVAGTGAAGPCVAGEASRPGPRTLAVVLYNGVELLDFAGPSEVFAAAGRQAADASGGPPAFRVVTVARTDVLAGIAEGEGDLEGAAARYRAALAKAADDGEAWMRLGRLSMRARDHAAAVSSFVHASAAAALRPVALYDAACAGEGR